MNKRFSLRAAVVILLVSLGFVIGATPLKHILFMPNSFTIFEGQHISLPSGAVKASGIVTKKNEVVSLHQSGKTLQVTGDHFGETEMIFEMAGIPVKRVDVRVLKDIRVIPGGQSIGVKLNSKGVLVVGHHLIATKDGKQSPGEIAGIKVGDMIIKMNDSNIEELSDITPFIQKAGRTGEPLSLKILRNGKYFETKLQPLKDKDGHSYRIGLYIRDSAAGIGTLTFVHPSSLKYGAMGHVISDSDTKKPIAVDDGLVVRSNVTSIERGTSGNPGEKLARFSTDEKIIGGINRNSPFGIFGKMNEAVENELYKKPIPIALADQIEVGKATILTVINGEKIEAFEIQIEEVVEQKFPAIKGMRIKVTDPRLLDASGGIVQGMSGSPIIQNGKLIGAVTHVLVNDPTSGYGVHIEWMLKDAGVNIYEEMQQKKAS